ncbi:MAG: ATP-binding cassette domain-containing protein [Methanosarcinales archaeon]|nr:ATP-binding cassette domain-containing protein [Methanosarcinales archaeon]
MNKNKTSSVANIENVTFSYPQIDSPSLTDVNLDIERGEFVLLVGPSGCGKSTLVRTLNGLVPTLSGGKLDGRVLINGKDIKGEKIHKLALQVGMVFQNPDTQLFSLTIGEDIAFGPENLGMSKQDIIDRTDHALDVTGLKHLRDNFIFLLSGGEKQRTAIGGIIAMDPDLFILDEPTSDLDPVGTKEVLNIIKQLNKEKNISIILIEHKIDEVVKLASRVVLMEKGKITLDGDPCEIFSNHEDQMKKAGIYPPQLSEISNILNSTNNKKAMTYEAVLERMMKVLPGSNSDLRVNNTKPVNARPHLEIKELYHQFEGGAYGLKNINLQINQAEFIALIGHNGSGKTTLSHHLIGLLRPTQGKILINGTDICDLSTPQVAQEVGFLFQNPDNQIFTDKVNEEIKFGLKNMGLNDGEIDKRVNSALKMMELTEYKNRHPHSLSRGQRQRLAVASILAMEPNIIVLDEPTTGQDRAHVNKFLQHIKELNKLGKTVIFITHDMNIAARYSNRMIVMKKGEVFLDGPTRDVFSATEDLYTTHIEPPIITRLTLDMKKKGKNIPVMLTVDELRSYISANPILPKIT